MTHALVRLITLTVNSAAGCVDSFNIACNRLFASETEFRERLSTIVSTTISAVSVNTGKISGAIVIIRRNITENESTHKQLCIRHGSLVRSKNKNVDLGILSFVYLIMMTLYLSPYPL